MTTQDLVKGLDLTGQNPITATQINQLVDAGRLASDKGIIIWSTDTAEDTPDVPDPDATYIGIDPIWWMRYIWGRISFDTETVTLYKWVPGATPDATLLKWQDIQEDASAALAAAQLAQATADAAAGVASTASGLATTASNDAASANSSVTALQAIVTALQAQVNSLAGGFIRVGTLVPTFETTVFSITEDEGYVEADGSALSITTFANLFAKYGYTYGGSVGVSFNLPDCRGRGPIGVGTGAGLTARTLGQTGGSERVTLTAAQGSVPAHEHSFGIGFAGSTGTTVKQLWASGPAGLHHDTSEGGGSFLAVTEDLTPEDASTSHENMHPWFTCRWLIKT